MTALSFLAVHGVGSQRPGYSDPLKRGVLQRMHAHRGWPAGSTQWVEVCWGEALAADQRAYNREQGHGLVGRLLVDLAGDALAWGGAARDAIADRFLAGLRDCVGDRVVVIGHSLGGLIAWGGIRHAQAHQSTAAADYIGGLVVMGSPLPSALMGAGVGEPEPPACPVAWTSQPILELRDDDDLLAWSLVRERWPDLSRLVDARTVHADSVWSASPLDHMGYWSSDDVAEQIAVWVDGARP